MNREQHIEKIITQGNMEKTLSKEEKSKEVEKMRVEIAEVKKLIHNILERMGLTSEESAIIGSEILDAELRGISSHGLPKLFLLPYDVREREGKPELLQESGNFALINGKKELGYLVADQAVRILQDKARNEGMAMVGFFNAGRYGILTNYAERLARQDLVAIITNNGGPPVTAPFGGREPMFGTNPIAIGIPTEKDPFVLDMATSKVPWAAIREALVRGKPLPPKTFLDKAGRFTRKPERVNAVVPFGDAKGYALNLALEILTGALVGAKMGKEQKTKYDLGFFFMALDPARFRPIKDFKKEISSLLDIVRRSQPLKGTGSVRIPGEQSSRIKREQLAQGWIEIENRLFQDLRRLERGEEPLHFTLSTLTD